MIHISMLLVGVKKWFTYFSLATMSVVGTFLCFSSKNLFVVWLGFELKMFAVVPLLIHDESKSFLVSKSEMGVGFYYFMVQVMGSIFFAWGSMLGNAGMVGLIGLLMKFGFLPFFWWVPAVYSRLDWFWIFILSTLQKVPSFFLLRFTFDFSSSVMFYLCFFTLVVGMAGMYKKYYNLKNLMGWSSVTNGVMMILIYSHSFFYSLVYFIFYCLMMIFCCWCFSKAKTSKMKGFLGLKGSEFSYFFNGIFGLFYFSGLPPFLFFWSKMYFFCVLSKKVMGKKDIVDDIFGSLMSFVSGLTFSGLEWVGSVIIVLLMFLQVIVYLSVFFSFFVQLHSRMGVFSVKDMNWSMVYPFLMKVFLVFLVPVSFWLIL